MKRFLSVVLAIALILACAPAIPLTANAETSGYYTYRVSYGEATITGCSTSISGDITIPATLGGYPVTSIGSYAFLNCSSLISVVIPDSVTSIGSDAFYNCYSLASVVIGDSVTSIGSYAFLNCSSLTGIWVDADNTTYCSDEQGVLYNKAKTTLTQAPAKGITGTYTIPDSVTSIGDWAFVDCSSLTSIEIPDSVTSIGCAAFFYCSSLTSIEIPDRVTSIGDSAFEYCSSLESVVIGDSITAIPDYAFSYCSSLTSVVIGDSVTSIGNYAFRSCSSLSHVAYTGTPSQWNSIFIGIYNSDLTAATRHYEIRFEMIDNCVEAGVYCPVCKEFIVRTEKGNHQETPVPGYAPTCTESGLTDGSICTICGEVVTQQVEIPATGHDTIDGVCQNCDYGKNAVHIQGDAETFYSTFEKAFAAATSGTVKLLADATIGTLILNPNVTLDLNGHMLTADFVIVANGATILDGGSECIGGGKLQVAEMNLAFVRQNGQGIIPVWNGVDGYIFTKVTFQQMVRAAGEGAAQYIFLPNFSNAEAAALLVDGGADNDLKMKVGLTWNNGQCQQFYTYGDDLVKQVFESGGKLVFSLTITGIAGITDMVANAIILTDSGTQAINTSIALTAG